MSVTKVFSFPECWEDDIRMNAFFSPFRPKSINSVYYEKKMEFWQTLIYNFCKLKKGCPVFRKEDLEIAFKRKDQIPHCLDMIIEEMINQKIIQQQSDFFENSSLNWISWILCKLIKNPLTWGYNKIIPKSNQNTSEFIHCYLLKQFSNDLLFILQKYSGKVFSLDDVRKEINNEIFLSEFGLKICSYNLYLQKLIYLDCDASANSFEIKLIKIPSKTNPSDNLTDIDRNLQQLKFTKNYLSEEMKEIELEIAESDFLLRKHRVNNRKLAAVYFRKKHYFQNRCDKKRDVLFNIDVLIGNIEDAQDNGRIISALKMGSETLESLNLKITLENVNEIMSTMEDINVLNDHTERQDCIANFDMSDLNTTLDKELEELLLSENEPKHQNLQKESVNCVKENLDHLNNLNVLSCAPSSVNEAITN